MRVAVEGEDEVVALAGRQVEYLQVVLLAQLAELRRRIESRAHDGHRIVQHVEAPRAHGCLRDACRLAVRADIEGDVAVEGIVHADIAIHVACVRKDEVLDVALLHVHAAVLEVDHALVGADVDPLLRGIGRARDVAAAVLVGDLAIADDLERLRAHDLVFAAESGNRLVQDIQFGGLRMADLDGACCQRATQKQSCPALHLDSPF